MNDENDSTLAGTDAPSITLIPEAFGGTDNEPRVFTVDDVLAMAKRPEATAHVCIRGDLQDEHDELLRELSTLVTADGQLARGEDDSLGDSPAARARTVHTRLQRVRTEMAKNMWSVRFLGMDSEAFAVFNKKHRPKDENADRTDYNLRLIEACAVEPQIPLAKLYELNKTLGSAAMLELFSKAWKVCNQGGVSIPKLSSSLANLTLE